MKADRSHPLTMLSSQVRRAALIRRAFMLEWLTIAWMSLEAAVAIGSGVVAHSLTLVAFGIDSIIELASALVLVWRLNVELRRGAAFSEAAEERASKIGGALLFALAAYVIGSAGMGLWNRQGADFSVSGLVVALVAIPAMAVLSRLKLQVAEGLASRALRADAVEAITCGYLSFVVVIGLGAQLFFHAWWVDGVSSLAIVYFLLKEGHEAWKGDDCCDG
jgi:divalent metal cation (Fe/Co/Zn/Cd) transporter